MNFPRSRAEGAQPTFVPDSSVCHPAPALHPTFALHPVLCCNPTPALHPVLCCTLPLPCTQSCAAPRPCPAPHLCPAPSPVQHPASALHPFQPALTVAGGTQALPLSPDLTLLTTLIAAFSFLLFVSGNGLCTLHPVPSINHNHFAHGRALLGNSNSKIETYVSCGFWMLRFSSLVGEP